MTWLIPIAIVLVAALGEWLHLCRIRRLGRLAFGPSGRPRLWTWMAPPLRLLALAGLSWSLLVLFTLKPKAFGQEKEPSPARSCRHVVFVVDVSPSMFLADAGEDGKSRRRQRAAELVDSILERVMTDQCVFSVVGFYTKALTVATECRDPQIVRHIVGELPLSYAFEPGKTDMASGINQAFGLCKSWPEQSSTVIVVSDGDTLPDKGLEKPPKAVLRTIVLGVGSASNGIFIDGHQSRQDSRTLSQLARRIYGDYFNGNANHLPTALMSELAQDPGKSWLLGLGLRELALAVLCLSSLALALLPLALEQFGSPWRQPRTPNG